MKKVQIFSLLFLLAFAVAACTPQEQQKVSDAMMDDDATMEDSKDDAMMEDDSMMEEGDSMEKDDAMMEDDSMMEEGDSMEKDDAMMEEAATFNVGGTNFAFDVKEIKVKQGQKVVINFTSNGGFHDWVVDEFNAATSKVQAGQSTSVEFVADKKGTFEYYCSVGSHRQQGMIGKLIVE